MENKINSCRDSCDLIVNYSYVIETHDTKLWQKLWFFYVTGFKSRAQFILFVGGQTSYLKVNSSENYLSKISKICTPNITSKYLSQSPNVQVTSNLKYDHQQYVVAKVIKNNNDH